jgi:hypothetical protein
MKLLSHNKPLLAASVFFLAVATLGVTVELHHCHGMGGRFSTSACEMSAAQTCSMHSSAPRLTDQGTCCESHIFTLTSDDPFTPSIQKLDLYQAAKILSPAFSLLYESVPYIKISYPLKFLPHSPPLVLAEHIELLNSNLLI